MNDLPHFVATHLLEVFLGIWLLTLIIAGLLWKLVASTRIPLWSRSARWWHAFRQTPFVTRLPQRATLLSRLRTPRIFVGGYLLLDLLAGFVLALGALSLFFEIADEAQLDEDLGVFDERLASEFAAVLSDATLRAFAVITHLGDAEVQWTLGISIALLLWFTRRRWQAASWIAAVAGNGMMNRALKALFQRERPLHDHGWTVEAGWSFPSGHASGAVAVYGMLAYLIIRNTPSAWHLPTALSAIGVILAVGLSRVVLQVHYFSDVIAGFASASAWLLVCIATAEMIRARQAGAVTASPL